jgi:hypothetical protein
MKTSRTPATWLLAIAPALALSACGGSDDDDNTGSQCVGGKCDEVAPEDFSCQSLVDESGRGAGVLEQLSDPFAEFVLKRGPKGCSGSFQDAMARLRANDTENCPDAGSGMTTKFISETEEFAAGSGVRAVTTRRCGGRDEADLIFSLFGVRAGSKLPSTAEVIAFDPESGEYNYYEVGGGQAHFFGSSSDFIAGNGGRCKNCHTAGGLVMKELRNPWMHWEGKGVGDAAGKLIDDNPDDLGSSKFSRGSSMEGLTNAGNRKWLDRKVQLLTNPDGGFTVKDMLRPLFCGTQVQLDTLSTSQSSEPTRIPDGVFAHCKMFGASSCGGTHFGESGGVKIESGIYDAAISEAGQSVQGLGVDDTLFKGVFIEPANEDNVYLDKLVDAGVLDDDFITDVLAVDFTRSVFSSDRCALLEFAPEWAELPEGGAADAGADGGSTDDGGATGGSTGAGDGMGGTTGGGAVDTGASGAPCCAPQGAGGCVTDPTLEACVCAEDAFCCDSEWDDICVGLATDTCGAVCDGSRAADFGSLDVVAEATPDTLRAAFIANLQAANPEAGSSTAQLLNSLQDTADAESQRARVKEFLTTCEGRDDAAFMADVLQVIEAGRAQASGLSVFEFPQTMARLASAPPSGARLDPSTCELTTN